MTDDALAEARARARRRADAARARLLAELRGLGGYGDHLIGAIETGSPAIEASAAPEDVARLITGLVTRGLRAHQAAVAWREAMVANSDMQHETKETRCTPTA